MEQALTHPNRPNSGSAAIRAPFTGNPFAPTQLVAHPHGAHQPGANPAPSPLGATPASGAAAVPESPGGQNGGPPLPLDDGDGGDELQDETPGRSPQRRAPSRTFPSPGESASATDPLAEGLGLLAGVCIGLLTLVVPLASVICDRAPGGGFGLETKARGHLQR